jgi:hypothetical protein
LRGRRAAVARFMLRGCRLRRDGSPNAARALQHRRLPHADTPTFGRDAEIPYDQMTPEQQDAYRSLIETRGRLPGPNTIYVRKVLSDQHVRSAVEAEWTRSTSFELFSVAPRAARGSLASTSQVSSSPRIWWRNRAYSARRLWRLFMAPQPLRAAEHKSDKPPRTFLAL